MRDVNASVSEGLAEVIERIMARTPEERFSSAAELMAALKLAQESGGASATGRLETASVPSFAITEFVNVSRDASLDWLGGGMVETIEGELRKVSGLRVASRARVYQVIRGLRLNLEEPSALVTLGRRLGAKWFATGSFQRAGNRVRVLMSLVQTATGEVVPTEKVDGVWEDLFDVQDRVVAALKEALQVEVATTTEPALSAPAGPPSLDAYEHYASGRRCLNEMGRDSLVQAKQHFENAVALDPKYALAYSGFGNSACADFHSEFEPGRLVPSARTTGTYAGTRLRTGRTVSVALQHLLPDGRGREVPGGGRKGSRAAARSVSGPLFLRRLFDRGRGSRDGQLSKGHGWPYAGAGPGATDGRAMDGSGIRSALGRPIRSGAVAF